VVKKQRKIREGPDSPAQEFGFDLGDKEKPMVSGKKSFRA
jgi:hypothetical protein